MSRDEPRIFKQGIQTWGRENPHGSMLHEFIPVQDIETGEFVYGVWSIDTQVDHNRVRQLVTIECDEVVVNLQPTRVRFHKPAIDSAGDPDELEADTLRQIIRNLEEEVEGQDQAVRQADRARQDALAKMETYRQHMYTLRHGNDRLRKQIEELDHTADRFAAMQHRVLEVVGWIRRSVEREASETGAVSMMGRNALQWSIELEWVVEYGDTIEAIDEEEWGDE